jgi:hypothetical protein
LGGVNRPEQRCGGERDEFFARGERQIAALLTAADEFGLPRQRARALEFGCGLDRLSRALARRFTHVDAVDVSGAYVEQATRLNAGGRNCTFTRLDRGDLATFDAPPEILYRKLRLDPMRMLHVPRAQVLDSVQRAGGGLLSAVDDSLGGGYASLTYFVGRAQRRALT